MASTHPCPSPALLPTLAPTPPLDQVELQLHVAQQAVWAFEADKGRMPAVNDAADAAAVVGLAKDFEAKFGVLSGMGLEVDEAVASRVALHTGVELQPMCAFFGGVVAQELVKVAGKYTPIQQFLHLHCLDALPEQPLPADETTPLGCRYDDMIAVYGRTFQERLGDLRLAFPHLLSPSLACSHLSSPALTFPRLLSPSRSGSATFASSWWAAARWAASS